MPRPSSKAKTPRAIRLDRYLPYLFSLLGHRFLLGNDELEAHGHRLTAQEWKVLAIVADRRAATPSEIGRFGTQDKSTISWAIKRLKKRGLIATRPKPGDARTFEASMTPRGWALYETLASRARRRAAEGLAALSAEERRVLTRLVTRLARP